MSEETKNADKRSFFQELFSKLTGFLGKLNALEDIKRREKILSALNEMAIMLLSHKKDEIIVDTVLSNSLKLISGPAGIDRVAIYRFLSSKQNADRVLEQVYLWSGETLPLETEPLIQPGSPVVYRWLDVLAGGNCLNINAEKAPQDEAFYFNKFNVKSILFAPIFMREEFWGIAALEDRSNYRYFNEKYLDLLSLAAHLCVDTIIRAGMELNIKNMTENISQQKELLKVRLKQQLLLSEISRGFISSGDSQVYIKDAIAKVGRYYKASKVVIFSIDYAARNSSLVYNWSATEEQPHSVEFDIFGSVKERFPEHLAGWISAPFFAYEDLACSPNSEFYPLLSTGIRAFVCAPIYVDSRLWGILSVEQNEPRKWTDIEKNFVVTTAGTIAGIIMREIYNNKLQKALHNATEASKAKSDFLSNMSHEMRTPLNAIIGMTAIGKKSAEIEKKDFALDKIEDASAHLLGVINDVLDISKIEANKFELFYQEFHFEKMVQRIVNVVNYRVDEKKQDLIVSIDESIPEILVGDEQRIAQVIANLLGNAVKFTPDNGIIKLSAKLLEEDKGICTLQISVADTGIGISFEQQKRLFQSFQQAESSTARKYGGTGLGLAISKSIVELMNGKIWIDSEPNKGSVFTFTIKVKRAKGEILTLQERPAHLNYNDCFKGYCILLAEDVEINREIVLSILEPTGAVIECAENGKQAVEMFCNDPQKYKIILMDVQMPEMDGYEATRHIRIFEAEQHKNTTVPVIAMTANVFKEDIDKCFEAGMNDHVGKPLNIDIFMEKLRNYLMQ